MEPPLKWPCVSYYVVLVQALTNGRLAALLEPWEERVKTVITYT